MTRSCANCGRRFEVEDRLVTPGRGLHCSRACANKARTKPALPCTICGGEKPYKRRHKKTCSTACQREAVRLAKLGDRNPNFADGGAITNARRRWHEAAAKKCALCPREGRLHQHHVVYRQKVRREGGDIYDARNSLTLCVSCHAAHHHNHPVPLAKLRDENYIFAVELLGPGAAYEYLRRRYGGRDKRLDLLLRTAERIEAVAA